MFRRVRMRPCIFRLNESSGNGTAIYWFGWNGFSHCLLILDWAGFTARGEWWLNANGAEVESQSH